MKKGLLGCGAALVVGLVILVIIGIGSYNRFVKLSTGVDGQWAQVQNVYQRRLDLIPNLVNTVQGAANFEKSTLKEVVEARASVGKVEINANQAPASAQQLQQFQQAQDSLSSALSRLLVVVERYPELRANSNFQNLQAQIEGAENRIAVERGRFNDVVRDYNAAVKSFPGVIVASLFRFEPRPFFTADAGAQKAPEVKFDFNAPTNR
ncbi:MAG TPA: LemA family protein [Methylomirabilota bacterium]|nr:LemA family protein [Methylomirabilota bacterium]